MSQKMPILELTGISRLYNCYNFSTDNRKPDAGFLGFCQATHTLAKRAFPDPACATQETCQTHHKSRHNRLYRPPSRDSIRCLYGLGVWVFVGFFNMPDILDSSHYQWQLYLILINWSMIFFSYFYVCYRNNRFDLFKDILGLFFIWLLAGFITCRALAQLFGNRLSGKDKSHPY